MKWSVELGAMLALAGALSGCSACQNPFDYCAPVNLDNGCHNCDFCARRGSIFAPVDGIPATTTSGPPPGTGTDPLPPSAEPQRESPSPEPEEIRTTELDDEERLR